MQQYIMKVYTFYEGHVQQSKTDLKCTAWSYTVPDCEAASFNNSYAAMIRARFVILVTDSFPLGEVEKEVVIHRSSARNLQEMKYMMPTLIYNFS